MRSSLSVLFSVSAEVLFTTNLWGRFTTAVLIIKNDVISEVLYEFEF